MCEILMHTGWTFEYLFTLSKYQFDLMATGIVRHYLRLNPPMDKSSDKVADETSAFEARVKAKLKASGRTSMSLLEAFQ